MNLQVNLIRATERRSASLVSLKAVGMIVAIVLPLIFVLLYMAMYFQLAEARSELVMLESEWGRTGPRVQEADDLITRYDELMVYSEAVQGWNRSRLPWGAYLDALQRQVPERIQLRSMLMSQVLAREGDGPLERRHVVVITGRCQGPGADELVEAFRAAFTSTAPLEQWVKRAAIVSFGEDRTPGTAADHYLFELELEFHPGSFDAVAAE